MSQALSLYAPLVILAMVTRYIGNSIGGSFSEVVLVFVILTLTGTAIAVHRGLEPYSTVLCSLGLLVSIMSGLLPAGDYYQEVWLLPALVPSLMVVMESGEHGSLVWRLAYKKGKGDQMTEVMGGESGDKQMDEDIKFLRGVFESQGPRNITEAKQFANVYGYTDGNLVKGVFQSYKIARISKANMEGKTKTRQVKYKPNGNSTIDGGLGHQPRRSGGF